jgi:uncharacterized membrane protein
VGGHNPLTQLAQSLESAYNPYVQIAITGGIMTKPHQWEQQIVAAIFKKAQTLRQVSGVINLDQQIAKLTDKEIIETIDELLALSGNSKRPRHASMLYANLWVRNIKKGLED